ncbi:disease resistance protein RPV1-like [Euphorbia lathyris]|uniref:disease resistance protein RPV1-like n=1 Tax=Euphorbia lathyris TaxID=212925 RepID=UPI003313F0F2
MGGSSSKVFISFRGADVRENFLSHLFSALERKKIKTFKDENLKRGEEITSSLVEIIKKSEISIVIFSQDYPYSPWCLDELFTILERKKKKKQLVVPIFYKVDPSDVQEVKGNYGSAIAQYNQHPQFRDKVNKWKLALTEISNLAGFYSLDSQYRPEAKLIDEVVKYVAVKLKDNESMIVAAVTAGATAGAIAGGGC